MENIGEIWYFLVPFLMQGGPLGVLVLVASKGVVLLFNGILEEIPCWGNQKYSKICYGPLLRVSYQSLTCGMTLRSKKVIFSLLKKLWIEKYPSSRFNHLSTTSASISPSNNGVSKFTWILKGVAWSIDEDASLMGNY
jgi:hypothetical protein